MANQVQNLKSLAYAVQEIF